MFHNVNECQTNNAYQKQTNMNYNQYLWKKTLEKDLN